MPHLTFPESWIRRIIKAVEYIEPIMYRRGRFNINTRALWGTNEQWVKPSGSVITINGWPFYAAKIQQVKRNDADTAFEWVDIGDVYLMAPNGETLDTTKRYLSFMTGMDAKNGTDERTVYVATIGGGGGGSSVALCSPLGAYTLVNNQKIYSAAKRIWSETTDAFVDSGGQNTIWLTNYHNADLTSDGVTGVYLAITNGDETVNSVTRPLYVTVDRRWVHNVICDTTVTPAVLNVSKGN